MTKSVRRSARVPPTVAKSCDGLPQHLADQRPRFPVSRPQQEQITAQFLDASTKGDLQDLLLLLAKDVTFCSDGGGKVIAAIKPIHGGMKVARMLSYSSPMDA
ncbi:hypothetical protein QT986_18830 [Microcoleus sp. herbarium14]